MKKFILLCVMSISLINAQEIDLNENLLLHYKFDGDLSDESLNSYDGTGVALNYTFDRFGNHEKAILFNGWSTYVDFPNIAELKPQLPVSFSFWIRYDSSAYADRDVFNTSFNVTKSAGVFFNNQSVTGKYAVNFGDGSLTLSSSTRRSMISNNFIETGVWHHISIVVVSGQEILLYKDGDLTRSVYDGSGGELAYSDDPGTIGRHYRGFQIINYFKGAIDDFYYWDKVLSETEITKVFNGESLSVSKFKSSFKLYVNSETNCLEIFGISNLVEVIVYELKGRELIRTNKVNELNLSTYKKGMYIVVLNSNNQTYSKKIIIN